MPLTEASERYRRLVLSPWRFQAYLWARLPLAACAGVRLKAIDASSCTVSLPGGWRTRNPFGSTYFAAQAMAAEMSTGVPALVLVRGSSASVALILREVRAVFTKRILGRSSFTFSDVAGMQAVVERAARSGESEAYTGRSTGRTEAGEVAAEFDITWSFKRRS